MMTALISDHGAATADAATADVATAGRSTRRLVTILAALGLFVVNVDPGTLQPPPALPLSSLLWLLIGFAWCLPSIMIVRSLRLVNDGATIWLLSLFGLAVTSALWSVHPLRSLSAATVSLMTVVGAIGAASFLGWRTMVRIASASLCAFTLFGLVRDAALASLLSRIPSVLGGTERFAGLSFSPTDLGQVASFAVLLSLMAATQVVGRERRFHVAAAAIGFAALITSGTRLTALVLTCVAVVAIARYRSVGGLLILSGVIAAIVAVALDPLRLVDSLARPGESETHVLQFAGRTPVWSAAFESWSERPVLGFGWAANELVFQDAFVRDALGFNAFTGHNVGIGVLIDLGIVGLTLLMLAFVALWRSTRRAPGARLILLLVLLTGTIEATLSRPSLVMAMLGIVAVAGATENDRRASVDG